MAAEAIPNMNPMNVAHRRRFKPPHKIIIDEAVIRLFRLRNITNWKPLFEAFLHSTEVELTSIRCLKPHLFFGGKEIVCIKPGGDHEEYLQCVTVVLGRNNPKGYIFATTLANESVFNGVYNLPIIICNGDGTMVMKAPTAVQTQVGNPAPERRRMNKQIKRERAKILG